MLHDGMHNESPVIFLPLASGETARTFAYACNGPACQARDPPVAYAPAPHMARRPLRHHAEKFKRNKERPGESNGQTMEQRVRAIGKMFYLPR